MCLYEFLIDKMRRYNDFKINFYNIGQHLRNVLHYIENFL